MKSEHYGLARRAPSGLVAHGRQMEHELVRVADHVSQIGNVARVAMDELATNYLTAEQLAAQALTAAHTIAQNVPQTEATLAYLATLTQHFLHRMVTLTNLANDTIIRHTHTKYR